LDKITYELSELVGLTKKLRYVGDDYVDTCYQAEKLQWGTPNLIVMDYIMEGQ
jgi:hypothetical protein